MLLVQGGCNEIAGDTARGARFHEGCVGCHGTALCAAPKAKVKTLDDLRAEAERRNDRMSPKFAGQEVEDRVACINASIYKFPTP